MPALIETGVSNQQLLAVWSTNADTGFTIDQLLAAGITLSQMYAGGIPGHILFNEACNTPLSVGTGSAPKIKLLSTNLVAINTHIVLEGRTVGSTAIGWTISNIGVNLIFRSSDNVNHTGMIGSATAVYLGREDGNLVSTINIPFEYVFSNFVVDLIDAQLRKTVIQLCPGR